jgi:hypothetical protein
MQYKVANIIVGWIVFLISAFVLISTAESSGSLWDCGEFIAGAYKLQVMHPPGAPLFLMLGRIFTLFAGDDVTRVAFMVNTMSALASAFAVLFIFWIITAMVKRILVGNAKEVPLEKMIVILGSGVVGALACSFMDTLWFSASEGEVYALSTFFIAIVLWALVRWDEEADEKQGNRWLVFMSLMIGLSIGVHLLSLLVLPVTALVYYFKKYKPTALGTIVALIAGFIVLFIVQYGVILILTGIAGKIEFLFVNTFRLPFNVGISFSYILYFGLIVFAIYMAHRIKHADLQLAALCLLMVMMGFMSYLMVPIRSAANPPINMNTPTDVFSLISYLNREQYGERPLLFGPYYDADPINIKSDGMSYYRNNTTKRYEIKGEKNKYVYKDEDNKFFPRMYPPNSDREEMVRLYQYWAQFTGKPTFADNLSYFFKYQVNYMYWRYFLWNFAGRQDDFQGTAESRYTNGNWRTGLMFLDQSRGVDAPDVPKVIAEQKARNSFYLLPLIFGVIGLVFQIQRDRKHAFYLILLFIITGLLLIVYSNQPPREPRERDYVLVGSFMTFCIWIGLGVAAMYEFLKSRKMPGLPSAIAVSVLGLMAVPYIMAKEGYDDHNRNGRFMARDMATNYLESCPPNAILFTQGDNDTYPLWYAQEVEGVRPDVRVVNLSLAGVDWYLEWTQTAANAAGPVPYHKDFSVNTYLGQQREFIQVVANNQVADPNIHYDLNTILSFVLSDDPQMKLATRSGSPVNYFPTGKFRLQIDPEQAAKAVPAHFYDRIVPEMRWELGKTSVYKFDLAVLAMIAGTDWSRPICFANTVSPNYYQGLDKYLLQKGLVYQLLPALFPENQRGYTIMDLDYSLEKVRNFAYGNIDKEPMFIDENSHRLMNVQKGSHLRLAEELIRANRGEDAQEVLDRIEKGFPYFNMPYYTPYNGLFNLYNVQWIDLLYRSGNREKGLELAGMFIEDLADCMRFYSGSSAFAKAFATAELRTATDYARRFELIASMNTDEMLMALLKKNFPGLISGEMNVMEQYQRAIQQ